MEALVVGAVMVAVLIGIDRAGLWAERRGWVFWRKSKPGGTSGAGGGMLGVMDELFAPARRHMTEEIVTKQNSRVDLDVGDGGWIDLDNGRARLPETAHSPSSVSRTET